MKKHNQGFPICLSLHKKVEDITRFYKSFFLLFVEIKAHALVEAKTTEKTHKDEGIQEKYVYNKQKTIDRDR